MSSDTFSAALKQLQAHTTYSTPQIYAHVANLLSQYSTGLSLAIAQDSLIEHSKPHPPPLPYIEATVIATHPTPTIHVLKSATRHIAFFPPSNYPTLPLTTTLRFPLPQPSAEALSLANRCITDYHITRAVLPTQAVALRLPFQHNLPSSEPSYSLLSIWHNRDLTPPAVYATFIEKQSEHPALVLVDHPDSPSVLLKLSASRYPLLQLLPLPCQILVTAPAVTPGDDSFVLHDTPSSVFFYRPLPVVKKGKKRQRSPSTDILYKAADLDSLRRCQHLQSITVHTRVEKAESCDGVYVQICENISVQVPRGDYQHGDEILLQNVMYKKRWVADHVTNISTMQGVLHCPFIRNLVSIDHATKLCLDNGYTTAHIKVSVNAAVQQARFLRLTVVDCGQSQQHGAVYLHTRGFQQLFTFFRQPFLQLDNDQVEENLARISGFVWLMTVTCGVADLPVLTACLRAA